MRTPPTQSLRMTRCIAAALALLLNTAVVSATDTPALSALPPIPDVGEPFDVKNFISVPFSYRNNAFTAYRHADRSYVAAQNAVKAAKQPGAFIDWKSFNKSLGETLEEGWSHANADVRDWLAANEFPLEIWHRGTECADAMDIPPADIHETSTGLRSFAELREFTRLACLKAARVTAQGKSADAWTWYRGALRSSAHVAMHGELIGRLVGIAIYHTTANEIRPWAARPDLSARDLRQALTDAIAVNEMTPPPSDALKGDYLRWRTKADRRQALEYTVRYVDHHVGYFSPVLELLGYEERARRTLNLVYANLLSQADRPRFRRSPIRGKLGLFGRGPLAPVTAKVYSDEEIEGKFLTFTPDLKIAQLFLPPKAIFDAFDGERAKQAALVLGLALQLHYREHGQFPATLAELVRDGYVKSIPRDPFGKGEPFHYRRDNDSRNGAVLWSVWWDGIDQQGKVDVWRTPGRTGDWILKIDAPR
jgi:hypothetical protein